jgi:hypothetical protein
MVPSSRTPLRPDRLRALNLPVSVIVVSDVWGVPTEVVESDGNGGNDGSDGTARRATSRRRGGVDGLGPVGADGVGGRVPSGGEEDGGSPVGTGGRRVDAVVETWVVQDEWWRSPIHRRYVEVVLEGGAHVVLFEDLTTGEWFMQRP